MFPKYREIILHYSDCGKLACSSPTVKKLSNSTLEKLSYSALTVGEKKILHTLTC